MTSATPPLIALIQGRKARPRRAPRIRPLESKLQCDVAALLCDHCLPDWRWTHFPAGERRSIITGSRLKRYGLARGWPDIILLSPAGRFHGLELKRQAESLTDDQAEFQLWCIRHAVPHSVAFTLDQALAFLDAIGCLRIRIGGASSSRPYPRDFRTGL